MMLVLSDDVKKKLIIIIIIYKNRICSNNNYIKTITVRRAMYGLLQSATGRSFRKDKKCIQNNNDE
jgi:hypothetical protein